MARQPYFREPDGELITQAGYDNKAQRFGVFDARQFVIPNPTPDAARMDLLRKSGEFPMSYEELDDTAATVYEGI